MARNRFLLRIVGLACAAMVSRAGFAAPHEVSISLHRTQGNGYKIQGSFLVQAPSATAWGVLTDYDHIHEFVSSMKKSRVTERQGSSLLLEQEALGKVLIFSKKMKVLLDVKEDAPGKISFVDIACQDFSAYSGSWTMKQETEGLIRVLYQLEAKPNFTAPHLIAKGAFKKNSKKLLEEIQHEIMKRAVAQTKE